MRKMVIAASVLAAGVAGLTACSTTDEVFEDTFTEAEEADSVVVTGQRNAKADLAYAASPLMRMARPPEPQITEQYEETDPNPVKLASEEPVSTFPLTSTLPPIR